MTMGAVERSWGSWVSLHVNVILDLRRKFNTPSSRLAAQVPLQRDLDVFVSNGR